MREPFACPHCGGDLAEGPGRLLCGPCGREYSTVGGVARFVQEPAYARSFGLQWNEFRLDQLDSHNGTDLSRTRFFTETGWSPDWLSGKLVLDAGCGAGRFAEIAASHGAHVVAVDVSSAVDAARRTLTGYPDACVVQASITELPFRPGTFDAVYCIGVVQHTRDPERTIEALARMLKPGGRLALTVYERGRPAAFSGRYLLRPLTRRLPPRVLSRAIRIAMPVLFPVTEVLFRLPGLGRLFRFAIPVANYVEVTELTLLHRYRWALLDTFDLLGPGYERPLTERELRAALPAGMVGVRRQSDSALNVVAQAGGR